MKLILTVMRRFIYSSGIRSLWELPLRRFMKEILCRQEGFLQLDRRRGAVICIDEDKLEALQDLKEQLRVLLAKGSCKNITKEEVHELVDEIYADYEQR